MNNSKLAIDSVPLTLETERDFTPQLRERQAKLLKLIDAIRSVQKSKEWSSLKTELFDGLTESLQGRIFNEATKDTPDPLKLARLTGELRWAEKYSDPSKLEQEFLSELANIKEKLHGTS